MFVWVDRMLTTLLFRVTGDGFFGLLLSHSRLTNGQPLQSYKLNIVRRLLQIGRKWKQNQYTVHFVFRGLCGGQWALICGGWT